MTAPAAVATICAARASDEPAIRSLLDAAGLPSQDVRCGAQDLLTAWDGAALVGVVGLERYGPDALLRSLAVAEAWRGRGLGDALCRRAIEVARGLGLRTLYLLTPTAAPFFAARGFSRLERAAVPSAVQASTQFGGLCCASAACLALELALPPGRDPGGTVACWSLPDAGR
jgi:amino-acid N-acetyltransferase